MRKKMILSLVFIFCSFSLAFAAFWDNVDVPLPRDAQLSDSRNLQTGNIERKMLTYKTNLSSDEVLEFYAEEMPKRGWQETTASLSGMLKNVPLPPEQNIPGMPSASEILSNVRSFTKGDYSVILVIVPVRAKKPFSIFTVNWGKKIELLDDQPPVAKKLDFMPVPPEAKLLFSTEKTYVYSVTQDIKNAISFYKLQMPNYGWQLTEETPVTEKGLNEAPSGFGQKEDCPGCNQNQGVPGNIPEDIKELIANRMRQAKVLTAELKYKKSNAEGLILNFKQITNIEGVPELGTHITVNRE